MVVTGDIALTGRVGSGQQFPFDHQQQALATASQQRSASLATKTFRGIMKALRCRPSSVSTAASGDSFWCYSSYSNTPTYDALAVVHIKGDKQASGMELDVSNAKTDQQQYSASLETAATGVQACKCHHQGVDRDLHAGKHSRVKAAAIFFATGLSYSAVSMPAFPVPITPFCPPVVL